MRPRKGNIYETSTDGKLVYIKRHKESDNKY